MKSSTCGNCERLLRNIRKLNASNSKLKREIDIQKGRIMELELRNLKLKKENDMLNRRLKLYENPNTPPSRRRYPKRRSCNNSERRYLGRPKGHHGNTRPKPRPEVVKPPPLKESVSTAGRLSASHAT